MYMLFFQYIHLLIFIYEIIIPSLHLSVYKIVCYLFTTKYDSM